METLQASGRRVERLEHTEVVFHLVSPEFIAKNAANAMNVITCARRTCTKRFIVQDGVYCAFWHYVVPTRYFEDGTRVFAWSFRGFCCEDCRLRAMPRRGLHWS